jgi:hypothetical protein
MSIMAKLSEEVAKLRAARLLKQINTEARKANINGATDAARLPSAGAVSADSAEVQVAFLRATADQISAVGKKLGDRRKNEDEYLNIDSHDDYPLAAAFVMGWLLRRNLPLTADDQAYLVGRTADVSLVCVYFWNFPYLNNLITLIEKQAKANGLDEAMKKQLGRLANALDWDDNNAVERKLIARLDALREGFSSLPIQPGEAWADAALAELKKMKSKERQAWEALLGQCAIHNPHKPSDGWLADAKPLLKAVGLKSFQSHLKAWAALVGKPGQRSVRIPNTNRTDNQKTLPVQRGRLEQLFLRRKSWDLETWRERYLQHPLVGTLAGRLIWQFSDANRRAAGIWYQDRFVDALGRPLTRLTDQTTVQLWHPLDQDTADVLAWRAWLEDHEVCQPFKQAHREIYSLTDAECQTRVYSNRFAAHILKQYQFNALCVARGWKYKPLAGFDEVEETARLEVPAWNLRAEFWIGLAGEVGDEMTDASVYLYVATDQVRFYKLGEAEGMPLDQVPPLVFSEVMRDVDLFVGVCSVGNDPNWADGGPDGRYREYWHDYSFGDLSATSQTRKAVLERLMPRLKIADRCSLADRWLVVRGDLRTYKIHLGSGNILMAPNDQYLCIVPKQTAADKDPVFLPFEGDATLSIILSKALLLAEDTKIKDATIMRQIRQR